MIDLNFHSVTNFTVGDVKELTNSSTGELFYIRTIRIEGKDGASCITMFSDVHGSLLMNAEGAK